MQETTRCVFAQQQPWSNLSTRVWGSRHSSNGLPGPWGEKYTVPEAQRAPPNGRYETLCHSVQRHVWCLTATALSPKSHGVSRVFGDAALAGSL